MINNIDDENKLSKILKKTDQFAEGSVKKKITSLFKEKDSNYTPDLLTNKSFMEMNINEYNLFLENYLKNSNYPDINN